MCSQLHIIAIQAGILQHTNVTDISTVFSLYLDAVWQIKRCICKGFSYVFHFVNLSSWKWLVRISFDKLLERKGLFISRRPGIVTVFGSLLTLQIVIRNCYDYSYMSWNPDSFHPHYSPSSPPPPRPLGVTTSYISSTLPFRSIRGIINMGEGGVGDGVTCHM